MRTFVIKLHKGHLIKHAEDVSGICNLWFGLLTFSHLDVLNIFSKFSAPAGLIQHFFLILLLLNVNFVHMTYNYFQKESKTDKELEVLCHSLEICVYMCLYMSACVSAASAAM